MAALVFQPDLVVSVERQRAEPPKGQSQTPPQPPPQPLPPTPQNWVDHWLLPYNCKPWAASGDNGSCHSA